MQINDFQQAHEELLREQDNRLRQEWEKDKRNAVRKIELDQTKKLSECHQKMSELEIELKNLRKENEQLQEKCKTRKRYSTIKTSPDLRNITEKEENFTSDLLEELKNILVQPDRDVIEDYQEIVKNANKWMIDNQLSRYEFKLIIEHDESELLKIFINIIDNERQKIASWPLVRLEIWFESIKEDKVSVNSPFVLFETEWTAHEINKELSTPSKILGRLNDLRNSITRSPLQRLKTAFLGEPKSRRKLLDENKENRLSSLTGEGFEMEAKQCLIDIASATIKLKKICRKPPMNTNTSIIDLDNSDDEASKSTEKTKNEVNKRAEKIENLVHDLNYILTERRLAKDQTKSPKAVKFLIE